jgi:hypothetical protein
MLSEQKRDLIKKILLLQRQKFKDNQARKSYKSNLKIQHIVFLISINHQKMRMVKPYLTSKFI